MKSFSNNLISKKSYQIESNPHCQVFAEMLHQSPRRCFDKSEEKKIGKLLPLEINQENINEEIDNIIKL